MPFASPQANARSPATSKGEIYRGINRRKRTHARNGTERAERNKKVTLEKKREWQQLKGLECRGVQM